MDDNHNLAERFERYEDEWEFRKITNPLHPRPDICALLLLDKLAPGKGDIICSAEHDQIWLDTDCYVLDEVATDEDIITLRRCGVFYDEEVDSLSMYE